MMQDVNLRDVHSSDLPIFFDHQADPDSNRMAAFPARARDAFDAHWTKIMADDANIIKTITVGGIVAGNIGSWEQAGERMIGYWLGKEFWGKGIASAALAQFLEQVTTRPLIAHVVKHNIASIRVLQKCGFTFARAETYDGIDGKPEEEFILTLG